MEYEDRLTIATPEGVELELTLAGPRSRFVAALVDLRSRSCSWSRSRCSSRSAAAGGVLIAIWAILTFLVVFGYDVAFEVLDSGRTPGKR